MEAEEKLAAKNVAHYEPSFGCTAIRETPLRCNLKRTFDGSLRDQREAGFASELYRKLQCQLAGLGRTQGSLDTLLERAADVSDRIPYSLKLADQFRRLVPVHNSAADNHRREGLLHFDIDLMPCVSLQWYSFQFYVLRSSAQNVGSCE